MTGYTNRMQVRFAEESSAQRVSEISYNGTYGTLVVGKTRLGQHDRRIALVELSDEGRSFCFVESFRGDESIGYESLGYSCFMGKEDISDAKKHMLDDSQRYTLGYEHVSEVRRIEDALSMTDDSVPTRPLTLAVNGLIFKVRRENASL